MQYALLIYATGGAGTSPEHRRTEAVSLPAEEPLPDWVAYTAALHDAGALLAGEVLRDVDTSTTLRVREQRALLVDGPFVETDEVLVGFYLIEASDLDVALGWAARMPDGEHRAVEVRPVLPSPASARAFRP